MTLFANGRRKGVGYVLLAAGLSGVSTPLAKTLVGSLSPALFAGLLYLGSGVGATLMGFTVPKVMTSDESSLSKSDIPWILGMVSFGGVIGPYLYLFGLRHLWASDVSLLLNFEGIFTILVACVVFHEQIDRRFTYGACAILLGSLIISSNGLQANYDILGAIAIIIACLCWGFDNNFMRKISQRNPFQIAGVKGFASGILDLILALPFLNSSPTLAIVGGLLIGLVSYGFCNIFLIFGLRHLGGARAGAYYSSAPFIAAILSVIMLREAITVFFVAAALAMAIGVWLVWTEKQN